MSAGKIRLTRSGLDKLKNELDFLTTKKRREIAKALEHARAFGDLKENAEYDAAKNAQAHNEKKIHDLTDKLSRAVLLDDDISKDKVFLGATVTVQDLGNKEKFDYTLVAGEEANFAESKISVESPIGKGLLGHKPGEKVTIQVPAGTLKYKILKIER